MGVGEQRMRVIGGSLRGQRFAAPGGRDTRPTSDRVREAVFSSLFSLTGGLEGRHVLDLYAGSGALGIEALSRGAAHSVFVERDRRAAGVIVANLEALRIPPARWRVLTRDASRLVTAAGLHPVSLLFADPPYTIDAADVWQVLEGLAGSGLLETGGVVVYEHRVDGAGVAPACFCVRAVKRYGDTGVTYATYEG